MEEHLRDLSKLPNTIETMPEEIRKRRGIYPDDIFTFLDGARVLVIQIYQSQNGNDAAITEGSISYGLMRNKEDNTQVYVRMIDQDRRVKGWATIRQVADAVDGREPITSRKGHGRHHWINIVGVGEVTCGGGNNKPNDSGNGTPPFNW